MSVCVSLLISYITVYHACRFVFGPGIGNAMGAVQAAGFAAGAMAAAFLIVLVAVPESYPPKQQAPTRGKRPAGTACCTQRHVCVAPPAPCSAEQCRRSKELSFLCTWQRSTATGHKRQQSIDDTRDMGRSACNKSPSSLLAGPPGIASAPSGTAAASAVLTPSPAAVATAATRRRHPKDLFRSMARSWSLINSSSMFRRLALCMAVVGIVSEVCWMGFEGLGR